MKVAVLTMTRDRLDYTKACFASLEANAGCEYDHYVLDQGSEDGTAEWLDAWHNLYAGRYAAIKYENVGICIGANYLLRNAEPDLYDVIVRFDNDCQVTQPDTLKVCAELAMDYGAIVAPRVNGLLNPPPTIRTVKLGNHLLDETAILGGIFMAIPAMLFTDHGYRWDEDGPLGTGDEAIVPWWRAQGHVTGYVQDLSVNHYETTVGQRARYPDYEARKVRELAAC